MTLLFCPSVKRSTGGKKDERPDVQTPEGCTEEEGEVEEGCSVADVEGELLLTEIPAALQIVIISSIDHTIGNL